MIHTVEGILFSDEASRAGVKGGVEVQRASATETKR